MPYSPIVVGKNPNGTDQTIQPFAKPFITPEQDYLNTHGYPHAVVIAPREEVIAPIYNQAANHKLSLCEAFYRSYLEPVILFAKMNAPSFLEKHLD